MLQFFMAMLFALNLAPSGNHYQHLIDQYKSNGSLSGKVLDEASGEALPFAAIAVQKGETIVTSTESDFDGNYQLNNIPAGTYDVLCSYVGYQPLLVKNVIIRSGQPTKLDLVFPMGSSSGVDIEQVVVTEYRIPLIEQMSSSGGMTLGSADIQNLATRNIGSLAATSAGIQQKDEGKRQNSNSNAGYIIMPSVSSVSQKDEGEALSFNGSRTSSNDTYVDGMRIARQDINSIPLSTDFPDYYLRFQAKKEAQQAAKEARLAEKQARQAAKLADKQAENAIAAAETEKTEEKPVVTEEEEGPLLPPAKPKMVENAPVETSKEAVSTFSIDVDNAGYVQIRSSVNAGNNPEPHTIRIEEMVNYFTYDYERPAADEHPFKVFTELSDCPWNDKAHLLHIGIQGGKVVLPPPPPAPKGVSEATVAPEEQSSYVFLVDVSGSMSSSTQTPGLSKLALVKNTMQNLIMGMKDQDQAAIVVYAGAAGLVCPMTKGKDKATLLAAMGNLEAGGSTAGGEGILLAYKTAKEAFIKDGNNRVILATDGDFNVGVSSTHELQKLIETERESGVFLSVFGVGYYANDPVMETLADKGNGAYFFLDNITESNRISSMAGTMRTIAKDVKLQLEFDTNAVVSYRLVGYENRVMENEDFANDAKDAGDLGEEHTVTALYEVVLQSNLSADAELMKLNLRYKKPQDKESQLLEYTVKNQYTPLEKASDNLGWASAVAGWGLLLRESIYIKNGFNVKSVLHLANKHKGKDQDAERQGFMDLVERWNKAKS